MNHPVTTKNFLFLLGILFVFSACNQEKKTIMTDDISTTPRDRWAEKHEPSDEFFMQRFGNDKAIAIEAYTNAVTALKNQAQVRDIDGFDLEWNTEGPGNIGARINTVAINPDNEDIIYAGFSAGGVYKTENGGDTWTSIFNGQAFNAIGDIYIDPNDSDIIYVGTGDANISGFTYLGDGVYRSEDGGDTWTNIGLTEQRIVSEIIVDHSNSNRIFAACMGLPFERGNQRGLYRSENYGQDWEQVLYISDSTGVTDIAMHPTNSQIMFAAGWDRIRTNFESLVAGEGAKLYKTVDGGDNWTVVEGGLPNNQIHGRMGIALYDANPNIMYLEYVGEDDQLEAIYRTNDGGDNWFEIPTEFQNGLDTNALGGFGWYFGRIHVNPSNPDDIYILGVNQWRSRNAGQEWDLATPPWWWYEVHADGHDLAFFANGDALLATDGGLYRRNGDSENDWVDIENIATTQFYRVGYNPHQPDIYYGGAQDNGTSAGNAEAINDWPRIFGGDGFQMVFDPNNPDRFFVETQRGRIYVTNDGGGYFDISEEGVDEDDRHNWDTPYFMSTHPPYVMYRGSQRVYLGFGDNPEWNVLSEDLTDGPDAASRNNTISALHESPLQVGLLYAGTGDGHLWRGENGGSIWIPIDSDLPDQYVTDVIASPTLTNRVFVTYSGYRDNDFLPRIHRSEDKGDNWTDISGDLPDIAINELLVVPETGDSVLFVATDGGVYGTVNAGTNWERVGNNMPILPVFDLVINETHNELVAGTFGRSIMSYPMDSLLSSFNTSIPTSVITTPTEPKPAIKIQPTVAQHTINVAFQNIEPQRNAEIAVISVDGKLMYHAKGISGQQVNHSIDVSNFTNGQYFVKVKTRHRVISEGFVVAR